MPKTFNIAKVLYPVSVDAILADDRLEESQYWKRHNKGRQDTGEANYKINTIKRYIK